MLSEAHISTKEKIIFTCDVLYMWNKRKLYAPTECTCMVAIILINYIYIYIHAECMCMVGM